MPDGSSRNICYHSDEENIAADRYTKLTLGTGYTCMIAFGVSLPVPVSSRSVKSVRTKWEIIFTTGTSVIRGPWVEEVSSCLSEFPQHNHPQLSLR